MAVVLQGIVPVLLMAMALWVASSSGQTPLQESLVLGRQEALQGWPALMAAAPSVRLGEGPFAAFQDSFPRWAPACVTALSSQGGLAPTNSRWSCPTGPTSPTPATQHSGLVSSARHSTAPLTADCFPSLV